MAFRKQGTVEKLVKHTVEWPQSQGPSDEQMKRALEARLAQLAAEIEKLKQTQRSSST